MIDPQRSQLFSYRILPQAGMEMVEIDEIQILILVEATENHLFLTGLWVDMSLKALGTNFLHHALHGGIYGADRLVIFAEKRLQNRTAGYFNSTHHGLGTNGYDPIDLA